MSKFTYLARPFIVPATTESAGKRRFIFDGEANGLLATATKAHCAVIRDLDSDQVAEYGPEQIDDAALAHLSRADELIGHNILGYDLPLLKRLYNWAPTAGCKITDTLVASRLILPDIGGLDDQAAAMGDPKLGKLRDSHSLEAWGARLGMPKVGADIEDWSVWTPEMQARCVGDTTICKALWQFLQVDGYSKPAMELEHRVAPICNRITVDGVPFDVDAGVRLREQWEHKRAELKATLQAQFPETNLSSRKQLGKLLEARDWVPKERTPKTRQPVINDEVLESISKLFPEFAGIAELDHLRRLIAQLATGEQAWLKHVGDDGCIHGGLVSIGTPHSRAKHLKPNLAQVPNPKKGSLYGSVCRALFRHSGDWVFVTCDQANLQDRAFAHCLAEFDGGAYLRAFLAGEDMHWRSAIALGLIPGGMVRDKGSKLHTAIRELAKTFRYGFLFGAGVGRCTEILTDGVRAIRNIEPTYTAPTNGARARNQFYAATPGLQKLRSKLEMHSKLRKWLPGLDGRRVPSRAQHTALNFTVASMEAIVCKRWLAQTHDELCTRFRYGWDGDVVICLWVHDEIAVCCRREIAEQVGEILVRHAIEAGAHYGLKVPLDASCTIGRSWAGEPLTAPDGCGAVEPSQAGAVESSQAGAVEPAHRDVGEVGTLGELLDALDREHAVGLDVGDGDVGDTHPTGRPEEAAGASNLAAAPREASPEPSVEAAVPEGGKPYNDALDDLFVADAAAPVDSEPVDSEPVDSDPAPADLGAAATGWSDGGKPGAGQEDTAGDGDPGAEAPHSGNGAAGATASPSTDPELGPTIYRDVRGNPYGKVVRTPNSGSRFAQKHWNGTAWAIGMPERKLPYRLPELLDANPADWVCIPEGEKDVVNLAKLGLNATTNLNGAKGWKTRQAHPLHRPLNAHRHL
jgi:DNA polymerase I